MKIFRFAMNTWITAASILSFLLGWVALAHAPKPVQNIQTPAASSPAIPTLVPLQSLQFGGDQGNTFQNFQVQIPVQVPNNNVSMPAFRTGGS